MVTMATDEGKVKIENFNGVDFGFWEKHIEYHLYQPLLWKKLEGMKKEEWALLDNQALRVIQLMLSWIVPFNMTKEKLTIGFMEDLSSMYEKP